MQEDLARTAMPFDDLLGLVLAVAGLGYLVYAMLCPERF
ncbi:MAG TPA: K(+)-transporting ATPase subunit F [Candidatus Tumulicola sp.]|nr:K(+)-transporting ATPase subunit F [Candidatus Tumulicola sp.]